MATFSTKGLQIMLEKADSTPIVLTTPALTAITKAKPAEVTCTNTLADGDIVKLVDTGFTELDGKLFVVSASSGTKFSLLGSDTTASTGTLKAAPKITIIKQADFTGICASEIAIDSAAPGTVSVATFCDLYASVPSSVVELGNATLSMYHDVTSDGFKLLEKLSNISDKKVLYIKFPNNAGTFVLYGTVSGFSITDIPLDGAASWSATFALGTKPQLVY